MRAGPVDAMQVLPGLVKTPQVGEDVLCKGKHAVVRFAGEADFAPGFWVGVEFLKAPNGRNDGSVNGIQYFGPTKPNHGLFIRWDENTMADIQPYSPQVEAATKLQSHVRRKQSADETHYVQAVRAMNVMESKTESAMLRANIDSMRTQAIMEADPRVDARPAGPRHSALPSMMMAQPQHPVSVPVSVGGMQPPQPPMRQRLPSGQAPPGNPWEQMRAERRTARPKTAPSSMLMDAAMNALDFDEYGREAEVYAGSPKIGFIPSDEGAGVTVTKASIDDVVRHIKQPDAPPLRASCVAKLVRNATDMFRTLVPSALVEIAAPPPPGRMIVVGDTHGQLNDVLWIMFKHGPPSKTNAYLINGDIADRGRFAVEIFVILLMYKLNCPSSVHFNRGNHEDCSMNECYGFLEECMGKWGRQMGIKVYDLFNALFEHMPLYSLVNKSIFVVHGGLCRRYYGLQQLRRIDFRRTIPIVPGVGLDTVVFDSVWSDPRETRGIGNNPRGDGIVTFGPDVTQRFLKGNNLRLIVRSHEVPENGRGFIWHHASHCLTIFSASNYVGECGNLGGVMILVGDEIQIEEHWAPSLEELLQLEAEVDSAHARIQGHAKMLDQQRRLLKAARVRIEHEVVERVQELVVQHKADLFEYWMGAGKSPSGAFKISAAVWREGCAAVLDEDLPWVRLQEVMGVLDASHEVHYLKFLTRYRVVFESTLGLTAAGWERAVWSKLMETMLKADLPLREALASLDATNDGLVSIVEFSRLLESCGVGISALQARALLHTFEAYPGPPGDTEKIVGGAWRVSVWDVLARLQVTMPIVSEHASLDKESASWAVAHLSALAKAVLDDAWSRLVPPGVHPDDWPAARLISVWFEDADTTQTGYLSRDAFLLALAKLGPQLELAGCPSDPASLARLGAYCDVVGNGRVNYFELLNGLTWEDSLPELRTDIVSCLHAAVFFNQTPIRKALQTLDPDLCGFCSQDDFVTALSAVQTALATGRGGGDSDLTVEQIKTMADNIAKDDDGAINYERFLKSFRIVDTLSASGFAGGLPSA